MPNKDKNFHQKTVSVYIGKKDGKVSRAVEVLAVKEGISESDLLKECFKFYCESIRLYRQENGVGQWNTGKIEALEKKYKKQDKTKVKLSREAIPDEEDEKVNPNVQKFWKR